MYFDEPGPPHGAPTIGEEPAWPPLDGLSSPGASLVEGPVEIQVVAAVAGAAPLLTHLTGWTMSLLAHGALLAGAWASTRVLPEMPTFAGSRYTASLEAVASTPQPEASVTAEITVEPTAEAQALPFELPLGEAALPTHLAEQIELEVEMAELAAAPRQAEMPPLAKMMETLEQPQEQERQQEAEPAPRESTAQSASTAARASDAGSQEETPAVLVDNTPPHYPGDAVRRRWQGTVLLRLTIAADGTVVRVEVVESSGYPMLDTAAANAVQTWRAQPARRAGTAIESQALLPVKFVLRR